MGAKGKVTSNTKLTAKQQAFVREYLIDLNGTQAAIRAGFSEKTAEQQSYQLLQKTSVQKAIQAAADKRAERLDISADAILAEVRRLAFVDIRKLYREDGSLKLPHELDDDIAAALSSIETVEMAGGMQASSDDGVKHIPMYTKRVKLWDKRGSLELLGKHLKLFSDKSELDVNMTLNVITNVPQVEHS